MSNQGRPSRDELVDLFVYAPIGLALRVKASLPQLVQEGRASASGPLYFARLIGEAAAKKAAETGKAATEQTLRRHFGGGEQAGASSGRAYESTSSNRSSSTDVDTSETAAPTPKSRPQREEPRTEPGPKSRRRSGDDFPIPGYESLSATQVLAHLSRLSHEELRAVELFEQANRSRKTVLVRIAELLARDSEG